MSYLLDSLYSLAQRNGAMDKVLAESIRVVYTTALGKWNAVDASETVKGIVKLNSSVNSESKIEAATPYAVKQAYDLAASNAGVMEATTSIKGIVQLSTAVNSTSTTMAATPSAVKQAYDLAASKWKAVDASKSTKGIVKIGDNINVTDGIISVSMLKGATATVDGTAGIVPAPLKTQQELYLRGDGIWTVPPDVHVTNTLNNTVKAYITGTTSATTNTGTQVFDNGVYLTTTPGELVATKFTGTLNGSAATAEKLTTARKINNTNFDGSADITTALWGTARTVSLVDNDSTNTGTVVSVNGSANVTLKLPATIKASITGNVTGNCSGSSGSCTGNSATATKFASNQSVTLTGDITGTASSQAGWSINTTRKSCILGQSGSTNTKPWYKVATCVADASNEDYECIFLVEDTYSSHKFGLLRIHLRTDENKILSSNACTIEWLSNTGFNVTDFVIVLPTSISSTAELWTKIDIGYMFRRFTVLSEGTRTSTNNKWTLLNASSAGQSASISTSGTQKNSVLSGYVASSAACTGNAATATKAIQDDRGNVIRDSYLSIIDTGDVQEILGDKEFTGNVFITNTYDKLVTLKAGENVIDVSKGSVFYKKITTGLGTVRLSLTGAIEGRASTCSLVIDRGGSAQINWANVIWAGGTPPTLSAMGEDILTFICYNGDNNWYGIISYSDAV